jgi:argininosuccinate synthase
MEGDASTYDQSDATGFIRLNALRLRARAALKSSTKE